MLAKRYNVVQMRQFFSSKSCVRLLSLPVWGEWIEISWEADAQAAAASLPVWGEWIEIAGLQSPISAPCVSPRVGRVD